MEQIGSTSFPRENLTQGIYLQSEINQNTEVFVVGYPEELVCSLISIIKLI